MAIPRDRPATEGARAGSQARITDAMVRAGEAVLEAACESADIFPPSYSVVTSAREVYIAMERARTLRARGGSRRFAPACAPHAEQSV